MAEKPGMMLYFDLWEPLMSLDNASLCALFRAAVQYARDGERPSFTGLRSVLWELIRPAIDRDDAAYREKCLRASYAAYVRHTRAEGLEPEDYMTWRESNRFDSLPDTEAAADPYPDPDPEAYAIP